MLQPIGGPPPVPSLFGRATALLVYVIEKTVFIL
jgi:hypothetical protein